MHTRAEAEALPEVGEPLGLLDLCGAAGVEWVILWRQHHQITKLYAIRSLELFEVSFWASHVTPHTMRRRRYGSCKTSVAVRLTASGRRHHEPKEPPGGVGAMKI